MKYRYFICDVFTEHRFGGNQLAVLPHADGLSDRQMQQIAREFNFSETTFVFPSATSADREVRIFTPVVEVPFAGHPNIGTAFVLASLGEIEVADTMATVAFQEKAGVVQIDIVRGEEGNLRCELVAPSELVLGKTVTPEALAPAVSLSEKEILTTTHPPQFASVGLPFLIAELKDRAALERARIHLDHLEALTSSEVTSMIHLYTRSRDAFDLRARMFAPLCGVPEDPATGSANCTLGALLGHYHDETDGAFRWRIAQGEEMGRPSVLDVRSQKQNGRVCEARVGGPSVLVAEGMIQVDDASG